jgi:hypothetical protein
VNTNCLTDKASPHVIFLLLQTISYFSSLAASAEGWAAGVQQYQGKSVGLSSQWLGRGYQPTARWSMRMAYPTCEIAPLRTLAQRQGWALLLGILHHRRDVWWWVYLTPSLTSRYLRRWSPARPPHSSAEQDTPPWPALNPHFPLCIRRLPNSPNPCRWYARFRLGLWSSGGTNDRDSKFGVHFAKPLQVQGLKCIFFLYLIMHEADNFLVKQRTASITYIWENTRENKWRTGSAWGVKTTTQLSCIWTF